MENGNQQIDSFTVEDNVEIPQKYNRDQSPFVKTLLNLKVGQSFEYPADTAGAKGVYGHADDDRKFTVRTVSMTPAGEVTKRVWRVK